MLRDLRQQKLRTFLTLMGITWGTIAVSLLIAFGEGVHEKTARDMKGMGDHLVIVWPGRTTMPFQGLTKGRRILVTETDIEALRRDIPEGRFAGEYRGRQGRLWMSRGTTRLAPPITGVQPVFAEMRNLIPEAGGRFVNDRDVAERRRVVFLGNKLKNDLFGPAPAVGQTVMINAVPFSVVGVLVPKGQDGAYGGPDSDNAFIPETTFMTLDNRLNVDNFIFNARDPADTERVKQRVFEVLGRRHQFDPNDRQAMGMWDTTQGTQFITVFFMSLRIFLAVIGVCTLMVGGIGVSNIMYVVLEERTREIGIKMALGAKPRYIQRQFLLETIALTAVGGVLGFLITIAILAIFPLFQLDQYVGRPEASSLVVATTTILLGLVGLVAGYFPARRASMLDPVVALKLGA